jgi:hypothetical protein
VKALGTSPQRKPKEAKVLVAWTLSAIRRDSTSGAMKWSIAGADGMNSLGDWTGSQPEG